MFLTLTFSYIIVTIQQIFNIYSEYPLNYLMCDAVCTRACMCERARVWRDKKNKSKAYFKFYEHTTLT